MIDKETHSRHSSDWLVPWETPILPWDFPWDLVVPSIFGQTTPPDFQIRKNISPVLQSAISATG